MVTIAVNAEDADNPDIMRQIRQAMQGAMSNRPGGRAVFMGLPNGNGGFSNFNIGDFASDGQLDGLMNRLFEQQQGETTPATEAQISEIDVIVSGNLNYIKKLLFS